MKKIFGIFVMSILLLSVMSVGILAQEEGSEEINSESTNVFWEKVQLGVTSDNQKKVDLALKIADKRAIKAGKFSEEGKKDKAKLVLKEHEQAVEKAEKYFDEIAQDGSAEEIENALKATVKMQMALQLHKEKFVTIHSRILERQAEKMTEEKIAHLNEIFSKVDDRTTLAEERILQKQENLIARYKVLTGATDEEVETLMNGFRAEFQELMEQRKERITEKQRFIDEREIEFRKKVNSDGTSEIRFREEIKSNEISDESKIEFEDSSEKNLVDSGY